MKRRTPRRAGIRPPSTVRLAAALLLFLARLDVELAAVDFGAVERADRLRRGLLGRDVDNSVAQPGAGAGVARDRRAQHDAVGVERFGQPLIRKIRRQVADKHIPLATATPHQTGLVAIPWCRLR